MLGPQEEVLKMKDLLDSRVITKFSRMDEFMKEENMEKFIEAPETLGRRKNQKS